MANRRRKSIDSNKARDNINNYLKSKVFVKICDASDIEYIKVIKNYFNENGYDYSITNESGRTWILMDQSDSGFDSITLGQSQDIEKEILGIVNYMHSDFETDYKKILYYRDLYNKRKGLSFYEVNIDLFIDKYCSQLVGNKQDNLFYAISKDYFAEALLAYNTGAIDWDYSFGGMDKRFYFHLLDKIEENS